MKKIIYNDPVVGVIVTMSSTEDHLFLDLYDQIPSVKESFCLSRDRTCNQSKYIFRGISRVTPSLLIKNNIESLLEDCSYSLREEYLNRKVIEKIRI